MEFQMDLANRIIKMDIVMKGISNKELKKVKGSIFSRMDQVMLDCSKKDYSMERDY